MKALILILLTCPWLCVLGSAPDPDLTKEFWNSPQFIQSFMASYGFRSEIEPKISKSEQSLLKEVIAKAENQLEDAIALLEKNPSWASMLVNPRAAKPPPRSRRNSLL